MMQRSQRMIKIKGFAELNEQRAAIALGVRQQQLASCVQGLQQLEQFRLDYRQQVQTQAETGLKAIDLKDLMVFLKRLDQAILQQHDKIKQAESQVVEAREVWHSKYQRVQALERVIEDIQVEEQVTASRREQAEVDDFNLQSRFRDADQLL